MVRAKVQVSSLSLAPSPSFSFNAAVSSMPVPGVVDLLILDNNFRNELTLELLELSSFLDMRQSETRTSGYLTLAAATSDGFQQDDQTDLQTIHEELNRCLAILSSDRTKMLLALRTSPTYLRRTAAALQRQAEQEAKFYRYRCSLGIFHQHHGEMNLRSGVCKL